MYGDTYCDRVAADLGNNPITGLGSTAFLVAATVLIWMVAGQRPPVPPSVWLLPALAGVVGICGVAVHLFASPVTAALDSIAIHLFVVTAVVIVLRWMWAVPWRWAWLVAPGYAVFAIGLRSTAGASSGFLPALIGLVALGLALRVGGPDGAERFGAWLLGAGGLLAISMALHTVDGPLCRRLPIGAPFLSHCLNATVLFIVGYTVIRRWQTIGTRPAPDRPPGGSRLVG